MRLAWLSRFSNIVLMLLSLTPCSSAQPKNGFASEKPRVTARSLHQQITSDQLHSALHNLPLQFEENRGQAGLRARFIARGAGYTLLLNPDGLALNLAQSKGGSAVGVSMKLVGAQVISPVGQEQTATRTNYYIGPDPRRWFVDVPSYRSVAYRNIYPGIDLIYHGNGSQLEYDFVISAGSDPALIRMRFEGLKPLVKEKDLSFDGQDNLSVRALKAFQIVDGKKKEIEVAWETNEDQVFVRLGSYDHHHELIIDPIFFYGTYIGGNSNDNAVSVVKGSQQDQFYVALFTSSKQLEQPPAVTVANPACDAPVPPAVAKCGQETLILKIQATTRDLPIWGKTAAQTFTPPPPVLPSILAATYIGGGSSADETSPLSMAGDQAFNLYITGLTTNSQKLPLLGTQICTGNCPGFVAKLDSNLKLTYSLAFAAIGGAINVDFSGNAYITGSAVAGSLPTKPDDPIFQQSITAGSALTSGQHAYLSELGPTGVLLFSTFIGGSNFELGTAVAVSADANTVYVTGTTSSTDFPTKCSECQTKFAGGGGDVFVLAISNPASNPNLEYSTYLGGSGYDLSSSIAVDNAGNVVLVGSTTSTDFPNVPPPATSAPPFQFTQLDDAGNLAAPIKLSTKVPSNSTDGFVTSLSTNGTLRFTDFLGGSASTQSLTYANAVVLDQVGVIYVTGQSNANITFGNSSPDNSTTDFLGGTATVDNWPDTYNLVNGLPIVNDHVFFAQIDPSGQNLLQATIAGGDGNDRGASLSVTGYCFSAPPDTTLSYPACIGVASIVGYTTQPSNDAGLFGAAAVTTLYPINPPLPTKNPATTFPGSSGFFVQEQLAGYCNMQLQQQQGSKLTLGGLCVSGTSSGQVFVKDNGGNVVKTANITITGNSGLTPSGALALDLSGLANGPFTITFSFSPIGAVGAVGGCGLDGNNFPSGCPVIQTGGGGAGTLFNVSSGTLSVVLSCLGSNCSYNGAPNTVLVGQPVTLNGTVTNGIPNTVTWSSSQGTFTGPNPATSIAFTPGGTGGPVVVTATPVADPSAVSPTLTLNTFLPTTISLTGNGLLSYGQTSFNIVVTPQAGSTVPTGNITYQVDGGANGTGTLPLSGGRTSIGLANLGAGSHTLAVTYPGSGGTFLVGSSNTVTFNVDKAPLAVTAVSPPPITFGQTIPALTYNITGQFFNGDTQAVITGAATVTTTATSTSAPGTYPTDFSVKALVATNYSFTYVAGALTINPVGAAASPIISPTGGTFTATQTATIVDSQAGAKLYYTTDGTVPTTSSTLYTGPLTVSASETVRVIATVVGYQTSAISSTTFNLVPIMLSATSISFGSFVQGTSSGTQSIVVTNPGGNVLTGLTFKLSGANVGEFALPAGSTCSTTLSANASCSVLVNFTPGAVGTRSAALAISYAGIGSPQVVNLGGIGASPLSLTSSATQFVGGTNFQFAASGPVAWTASAGTISSSGLFTAPNPSTTPIQITITATSTVNPQIVVTTQATIFPPPALVVPANTTLPSGGSVSVPLSTSSGTGIPGESMGLACVPATLPTGVSCFFSPNPVINTGGTAINLQLFSSTTGYNMPSRYYPWKRLPFEGSVISLAGCIVLIKRKKFHGKILLALISAAVISMAACGTGGSFNSSTQQSHVTGTFTINISISGASPGAADYNQTLTTIPLKVTIQ